MKESMYEIVISNDQYNHLKQRIYASQQQNKELIYAMEVKNKQFQKTRSIKIQNQILKKQVKHLSKTVFYLMNKDQIKQEELKRKQALIEICLKNHSDFDQKHQNVELVDKLENQISQLKKNMVIQVEQLQEKIKSKNTQIEKLKEVYQNEKELMTKKIKKFKRQRNNLSEQKKVLKQKFEKKKLQSQQSTQMMIKYRNRLTECYQKQQKFNNQQ